MTRKRQTKGKIVSIHTLSVMFIYGKKKKQAIENHTGCKFNCMARLIAGEGAFNIQIAKRLKKSITLKSHALYFALKCLAL